jgi:hypothetical protein
MLALVVALTGAAGDLVQSWWWLAALGVVTVAGASPTGCSPGCGSLRRLRLPQPVW